MRSTIFALGAFALGSANAWSYPQCNTDNCYNELIDVRFAAEASSFCPEFLASTTTEASAIPTDFSNCNDGVDADYISAVSSACSCVTYTASSTAAATTTTTSSSSSSSSSAAASTSSTSSASGVVTSTSSSAAASSTSSVAYTTSTVYTTSIYTVTSCAATVTNCPAKGHVTTEIISLYTTICPVTETETASKTYSSKPAKTITIETTETFTITSCPATVTNCPVGKVTTSVYATTTCITEAESTSTAAGVPTTLTSAPTKSIASTGGVTKTTSGTLAVTAAAGRVHGGLEMVAAAAGFVAVAFL